MMKRSSSLAFVGASQSKQNYDGVNTFPSRPRGSMSPVGPSSTVMDLSMLPSSLHTTESASVVVDPTVASAAAAAQPTQVFEPIMPQTETLVGMGAIVFLSVVVSWVWANQVVPVSRTKLAIDKNRGELKEYLDDLKASGGTEYNNIDQGDGILQEMNSTSAVNSNDEATRTIQPLTSASTGDNRSFERWLFTDWLRDNKSARKPGRQKEPAIPILKDAKWNSGDNPVLVASTLIGLGVIVSSVIEQATTLSMN